MTVTAQQVYDMALVLMDEVEENGIIRPDNPVNVQTKAINILNILQFELFPSVTPTLLTDLSQNMAVSDRAALLILPYGLAAHLLVSEDNGSNLAVFFNERYEELKRKMPTKISTITDNYGVLGGMV